MNYAENGSSTLILEYCRLLDNLSGAALGGGGGILNQAWGGDTCVMIMRYCEVARNKCSGSDAVAGGISLSTFGSTAGYVLGTIENSSIHNNVAESSGSCRGGGINTSVDAAGGGIITLDITNSTISNNRAGKSGNTGSVYGGGICFENLATPSLSPLTTVNITNSTIAFNEVHSTSLAEGGGIGVETSMNVWLTVNLAGNIIAKNTFHGIIPPTSEPDIFAYNKNFFNDLGYNFVGAKGSISFDSTNITGSSWMPRDPFLLPLTDNGGFAPTHALSPCSEAIDKVLMGAPALDQRDSARVGIPDMGAVEFNPATYSPNFKLSGTASQSGGSPLTSTKIYLIVFNASDSSLSALDSVQTDANGDYQFTVTGGEVYLKAAPDSATYPGELPTYYDSSLVFQDASPIRLCGDSSIDVTTIAGNNPGGPGFIGGLILQGANKTVGDPLAGINLLLINAGNGDALDHSTTNADGYFNFGNLPQGDYEIWVDKAFIDNGRAPVITLNQQTPSKDSLEFFLHSDHLELVIVGSVSQSFEEAGFSIYPNPATESCILEIARPEPTGHGLEIMNVYGQVVKRTHLKDRWNRIDLTSLAAGLYILRIDGAHATSLIKK